MPLQPTQLAEQIPKTPIGGTVSTGNGDPDVDGLLASWQEYISKTGFDTTTRGIKAGFGEKDGIWFYHCAKAGTSFQQTLFKYACPRLPANTDNNSEITKNLLKSNVSNHILFDPVYCDMQVINPDYEFEYQDKFAGMAAGMIRDPVRRALSGYFFRLHVGIGGEKGEDPGSAGEPSPKMLEEITHSPTPFLTYANWTRIKGCQVRMLIGRGCGENYTPTTADVAKAVWVMKKEFLFVGITDDWAKSIFLFHGLFGGIPTKSEFYDMRRTNKDTEQEASCMQEVAAWHDPYDGPLFKEASELVNTQFLQVFGPGCKREPGMAFCQHFNINPPPPSRDHHHHLHRH